MDATPLTPQFSVLLEQKIDLLQLTERNGFLQRNGKVVSLQSGSYLSKKLTCKVLGHSRIVFKSHQFKVLKLGF
jgi:hypothetical protein